MNPFYYGGVAREERFCNRSEEIAEIRRDLDAGINLLLYAPRRFGKTSLILKALESADSPIVYFDLMSVVDENDFVRAYFRTIARSMERPVERIVRLLRDTLRFRPNVSATFDQSGTPTFSLDLSPENHRAALEDVLDLPFRLAEHRKKRSVVVFDEFQEIAGLGLESRLRSVIQHHGASVSYVFLGSKKSIMRRLFMEESSALYRSVKHVPIGPISGEEWTPFIVRGFASGGKRIGDAAISRILAVSNGFPYYTQQLAHELFAICGATVTSDEVEAAISSVIAKEEDLFLTEWNTLSANQKRALKLIAKSDSTSVYTADLLRRYGLSASAMKKALDGLVAKDIVDRAHKRWYAQDPLLEYYVRERL